MPKSKVSVRGQTVIPLEVREALGIEPNSELAWSVEDGVIVAVPIPKDPVEASIGMFAGRGFTLEDFLADRRAEREIERERDERIERQVASATRRTRKR